MREEQYSVEGQRFLPMSQPPPLCVCEGTLWDLLGFFELCPLLDAQIHEGWH